MELISTLKEKALSFFKLNDENDFQFRIEASDQIIDQFQDPIYSQFDAIFPETLILEPKNNQKEYKIFLF